MTADELKRAAAYAALEHVKDGMKLGLGTGSTAKHFVDGVGTLVAGGMSLVCVPTSEVTRTQAESLGIRLTSLGDLGQLDLTVDGADELDDQLRLIKGGGGALLREKIVASASNQMIVIADDSKHVGTLGAFPLPVEIVKFGAGATVRALKVVCEKFGIAGEVAQRRVGNRAFITDGGNYIFDCQFGSIQDPEGLADALIRTCGVVEHGLFINLADKAYLAVKGGVRAIERASH